jgi:hypothetical protein
MVISDNVYRLYMVIDYMHYIYIYTHWLVGWNMAFMTFHSVRNVIIPTDEVMFFQRGRYTTNQYIYVYIVYVYMYVYNLYSIIYSDSV